MNRTRLGVIVFAVAIAVAATEATLASPPADDTNTKDSGRVPQVERCTEPEVSQADREVSAALDKLLPEVALEHPLDEVIEFFADVLHTKIETDWQALEQAGIHRHAKVTLRLREVRSRKWLEAVLDSVTPDPQDRAVFFIRNGQITITTTTEMQRASTTQPTTSPSTQTARDQAVRLSTGSPRDARPNK